MYRERERSSGRSHNSDQAGMCFPTRHLCTTAGVCTKQAFVHHGRRVHQVGDGHFAFIGRMLPTAASILGTHTHSCRWDVLEVRAAAAVRPLLEGGPLTDLKDGHCAVLFLLLLILKVRFGPRGEGRRRIRMLEKG